MIQRVQQLRRLWHRLDNKTLFKMLACIPMVIPGIPFYLAAVRGTEIGEFVKQYGPFRLYRFSYVLRTGWTKDTNQYAIILGEPAVPLRTTWFARDTQFTRATDYVYVTKVAAKESDPAGLYQSLLRSLRAVTAVDNLRARYHMTPESPPPKTPPETVAKWRENEERYVVRKRTIGEALQQFEAEYATAIHAATIRARDKKNIEPTVEQFETIAVIVFVGIGACALPLLFLLAALSWLWRLVKDKMRAT